ncbi:MAG TPA: methyltransferase domain-containing protein [Lentimicrobium sp.]|nr:methyltransferase domain-containing protein [Lentimicrobium sp.]
MENLWDQRYASDAYFYGTEPNEWFAEKLRILKTGKILLPAEGEGRNAVWAAMQGWDVTAFDQSFEGKAKANKLAEAKGVKINYLLKDLRCYRAEENTFDAIALIYVHMPLEFRAKVHGELIKFLKPGGCLILEAFSKAQLPNNSGGPKDINMLYSAAELRSDFSNLKIMEFMDVRLHLEEGQHHKGIADVIRMFARKPF